MHPLTAGSPANHLCQQIVSTHLGLALPHYHWHKSLWEGGCPQRDATPSVRLLHPLACSPAAKANQPATRLVVQVEIPPPHKLLELLAIKVCHVISELILELPCMERRAPQDPCLSLPAYCKGFFGQLVLDRGVPATIGGDPTPHTCDKSS